MTRFDNITVKINKALLFIAILSLLTNIILATSSPLFENFFKGKISEIVTPSSFPVLYKNKSYNLTTFQYKHIGGKSIHKTTLDFRIKNSGAKIDHYEPFFYAMYNKSQIRQKLDKNNLKIDIDVIRPNDEFIIKLYSTNKADILSTVISSDGVCISGRYEDSFVRKPLIYIIIIVLAFFMLNYYYYRRTIKGLEAEKHRIIGEREALQQIIMAGNRKSTGRKKI